jgi:hypothetical protein
MTELAKFFQVNLNHKVANSTLFVFFLFIYKWIKKIRAS